MRALTPKQLHAIAPPAGGLGLAPAFIVPGPAESRAAVRDAFDAALSAFLAEPRVAALDLAAAYTVDRLQRMVVTAHDALRSRGQTRPRLPEPRPADLDVARAELERARAALAAELERAPNGGASVDAAREALASCRERLVSEDEVDV